MSTENESDDDDCEYCKKIASKKGGHLKDNIFFSSQFLHPALISITLSKK